MSVSQKLLYGAARIDAMRKDIKDVMTMVVGFIPEGAWDALKVDDGPSSRTISESLGRDAHKWHLRYGDGWLCLFRQTAKGPQQTVVAYNADHKEYQEPKKLEDVLFAHRHLDSFVEGMGRIFPAAAAAWSALLNITDH